TIKKGALPPPFPSCSSSQILEVEPQAELDRAGTERSARREQRVDDSERRAGVLRRCLRVAIDLVGGADRLVRVVRAVEALGEYRQVRGADGELLRQPQAQPVNVGEALAVAA